MDCLYICNPMSGKKDKHNDVIIKKLRQKFDVVDFVETQYKGHLTDILNEKYQQYDTIVLTGGDGTLNEAVNALADKDNTPSIGYIPSGTCNDVARTLGIPKSVNKALDIILRGRVFEYDLMKINQSYCIYVCGMGIFTSSSYSSNQSKKRRLGWLAYFFDGIRDAFAGKTFDLTIDSQQLCYTGKVALALFINSKSVAGFKFNKNAVLDDGKVDVCLFCEKSKKKHVSFLTKLRIVKMFLFGYDKIKNNSHTKVASISCAKVKNYMTINQDGEHGESTDFELSVIPKKVKIIC